MNDLGKYRLERAELDEAWNRFVDSSPSATGFMSSSYLDAVPVEKQAWYCYKSNELMAAVLLPVSADGASVTGHDFIIYDGLFYRDMSHLNRAQRGSEQFKIQQFVAEQLIERYDELRISLHPSVADIRPFLWVNYGEAAQPRYAADVRYTSVIDIADFAGAGDNEDIGLYRQASVARRQEIRYAAKKGVVTRASNDVAAFVAFYDMTMQRQDIEVSPDVLTAMQKLLESLIAGQRAEMFVSENADGRIGSMAVFLLDSRRAYYLFGANDPEMRNQHTGTAVLWDAFRVLAKAGYSEVDLEGVNSPRRGWFKLSFGGDIVPYYEIIKHGGH